MVTESDHRHDGFGNSFSGASEQRQHPRANSQKLIKNGLLFIERNGKTYNAQGAEVK